MEIPDLSNVRWRNLAAFGAIVGGTGLACATSGVSAVVGLGLAGIFGNIAAGDAARQWAQKRSDPKYAHPIHELTLLVGRAIARTFYDCADDPANKEYAAWFRALSKQAEASYVAISSHPDFDSLASSNLPELFEAAARQDGIYRFDLVNWSGLVEFIRAKTKQAKNPGAATIAASRLTVNLFANIREMFKRDFEGDGREYAALCIDVNGRLLAMLGNVARDQSKALRALSIHGADLREIKLLLHSRLDEHVSALPDEQSKAFSQLLVGIPKLVETVDSVLYEVWLIGERTQRIEQKQHEQATQKDVQAILGAIEELKRSPQNPALVQFPREIILAAERLQRRGDKEERALAASVKRQTLEADRMLDELLLEPQVEVVRLLNRKGDNWYVAGEFDRAIEPYEKAMTLRPEDFTCRNNVTIAHGQARLGDIAAHQLRAIEVGEGTLRLVPNGSVDWAMTQNNLGPAWKNMPTGDRIENLRKAIECYEAALTVHTKQRYPVAWAMIQNNLGVAWTGLPTGDRAENLRRAIECFEAALTVHTKQGHPVDWAMTQNNLGAAWQSLPTGDCGENLRKAIECYEAALTVCTKQAYPVDWAMTQNNLGAAWQSLPIGDRGENLRKAIECYEAALTVHTKQAQPVNWATIQNNLGTAWKGLSTGDRGENLRKAIECHEAALTVHTKQGHPVDWAMTQNNLGTAWQSLPIGDRGENLRKAIECCEEALTVYTKEAHPVDWAMTQNNLGAAWQSLPTGDRGENLRKAVECYEAALTVRTKQAHPADWAMTQNNLGNAWGGLPTGDRAENLRKAIECYEGSLTIKTKQGHPVDWALTQNNLGAAWQCLPIGDRAENLRRAIECFEAALTVRTKQAHPVAWAMTQNNLAIAYAGLAQARLGEQCKLLKKAIVCGKGAITIYTPIGFPREHAMTMNKLWIDRTAYESAGCAAHISFDEIRPAE